MKQATQGTILLYAYDPVTGTPATDLFGFAVTTYISKDGGTPAQTTNSVSEINSTNQPGWYKLTLTATETDCASALITATHTTARFATTVVNFHPSDYATASALSTLQTHGDSTWATADLTGIPAAVWSAETRTLSSVTLSSNEKESLAQAILTFNISTLDTSNVKYNLNSLIRAALLWERDGLTLNTLKTDGTTTLQSYTMVENNVDEVIKVS